MNQSRLACALAGAALSVLVLAGCSGGDPGAAQTPSESPSASAVPSASEAPSATPTPTPSPASAAGPAVNIPVPEKPALADENTVEGLEAFTEWWFELLNYAQATNDFEPLWAVTDTGCKTCTNFESFVSQSYDDGGWIVGGDLTIQSFDSSFEPTVDGTTDSYVTTTQDALTVYRQKNAVEEVDAYAEPTVGLAISAYESGTWRMYDYGDIAVTND